MLTVHSTSTLIVFPLGVEPWTYYFLNGFLNFNIVFLLALLAVPLIEAQVIPLYWIYRCHMT